MFKNPSRRDHTWAFLSSFFPPFPSFSLLIATSAVKYEYLCKWHVVLWMSHLIYCGGTANNYSCRDTFHKRKVLKYSNGKPSGKNTEQQLSIMRCQSDWQMFKYVSTDVRLINFRCRGHNYEMSASLSYGPAGQFHSCFKANGYISMAVDGEVTWRGKTTGPLVIQGPSLVMYHRASTSLKASIHIGDMTLT